MRARGLPLLAEEAHEVALRNQLSCFRVLLLALIVGIFGLVIAFFIRVVEGRLDFCRGGAALTPLPGWRRGDRIRHLPIQHLLQDLHTGPEGVRSPSRHQSPLIGILHAHQHRRPRDVLVLFQIYLVELQGLDPILVELQHLLYRWLLQAQLLIKRRPGMLHDPPERRKGLSDLGQRNEHANDLDLPRNLQTREHHAGAVAEASSVVQYQGLQGLCMTRRCLHTDKIPAHDAVHQGGLSNVRVADQADHYSAVFKTRLQLVTFTRNGLSCRSTLSSIRLQMLLVDAMALVDERLPADLERAIIIAPERLLGVADDTGNSRNAVSHAICPRQGFFWSHGVKLVHHHDQRLLQGARDMVDEGRRQVQQRMASIDDQSRDVAALQHSPQLPPHLQVLFERRRVAASV
mmetsp:Transcript_27258/g.90636  ORF Transcript_27258/g.90636 Transcript_27258/m.90636 type:complete len:404 (+) Transcript_27258:468-1679(+)